MRTKKYIFFLLFLFCCSCADTEKVSTEYYESGTIRQRKISLNDSTTLFLEYFENEVLEDSMTELNGLLSGEAKHYFPNGKLAQKWYWVGGRPNGPSIVYYESGNVLETAIFKDSLPNGNITTFFDSPDRQIKYLGNYAIVNGKKWVNWQMRFDSATGNVTYATTVLKEISGLRKITLGDSLKLTFHILHPEYPKTKVYFGNYTDDYVLSDTTSIKGSYGSKKTVSIYVRPEKTGNTTVRGILENYKILDSLKGGFTKSEGKMIYWSYDYEVARKP